MTRSSPPGTVGEQLILRTADLVPNPWNPNRQDEFMYGKELASIRRFGFVVPVVVRQTRGIYEIVDGEHRVRAAIALGIELIPVWNLGPISDSVAKQLTIVLNETRGNPEPERLGALLADLLSTETRESLLSVMPIPEPAFDRLIGLADFDWGSLEPSAKSASKESTSWVERTYRMPIDAAAVLDQAIERVRKSEPGIVDWQALELLAAQFLA